LAASNSISEQRRQRPAAKRRHIRRIDGRGRQSIGGDEACISWRHGGGVWRQHAAIGENLKISVSEGSVWRGSSSASIGIKTRCLSGISEA